MTELYRKLENLKFSLDALNLKGVILSQIDSNETVIYQLENKEAIIEFTGELRLSANFDERTLLYNELFMDNTDVIIPIIDELTARHVRMFESKNKKGFIYKITNKKTNLVYIGQTNRMFNNRWNI